jgi:hypothetical protein
VDREVDVDALVSEELAGEMMLEHGDLLGRPCYMHLRDGTKVELISRGWTLEEVTG